MRVLYYFFDEFEREPSIPSGYIDPSMVSDSTEGNANITNIYELIEVQKLSLQEILESGRTVVIYDWCQFERISIADMLIREEGEEREQMLVSCIKDLADESVIVNEIGMMPIFQEIRRFLNKENELEETVDESRPFKRIPSKSKLLIYLTKYSVIKFFTIMYCY